LKKSNLAHFSHIISKEVQNLSELLKKNSTVTKMLNKDEAIATVKKSFQSCTPNIEKAAQLNESHYA
jgi:hypothetical protein